MTPRRTARAFVCRRLLLFTLAVTGVVAAGGPIPLAAAAPGTISTLAGNPLIEGPATTFGQEVSGMAVSGQKLYIADDSKDVIHAVDIATDTESVIAGTSAAGFSGDGGPASAAELNSPDSLAIDSRGDLLIADEHNGRVRLIAAADCGADCPYGLSSMTKGDIYTIAGTGPTNGFRDGEGGVSAVHSGLGEPQSLTIGPNGDLLIAIKEKVVVIAGENCSGDCPYGLPTMTEGDIYQVAGLESQKPFTGNGEPATSVGVYPQKVSVDSEGDLLILDPTEWASQVQLVASGNCVSACPYGLSSMVAGDIYTIAGDGSETPQSEALATDTQIYSSSMTVDSEGNVVLGEGEDEEGRVEIVSAKSCASACPYGLLETTEGHLYPIVGGGTDTGDGAPGTQTSLTSALAVTVAPGVGLLFSSGGYVRLLAPSDCVGGCPFALPETVANDVYTVAGNGTVAFSGESGPPGSLELGWPRAVTSDAVGDVLVLDARNGRVRMITATKCVSGCAYGLPSTVRGEMYTIAGGGSSLEDGVQARSASLFGVRGNGRLEPDDTPTSMTVDASGDVIVSDGRRLVRLIAAFDCATSCPYGLHAMVAGDIYTIAGEGGEGAGGDGGPAIDAQLGYGERGMAVDPRGDLLIADTTNNRVRLVADSSCTTECPYGLQGMTKGDIYTVAGTGENGDKGNGKPATNAQLSKPADVTVDGEGNVLIADTGNFQARFVAAHSCASDCAYGQASTVAGDIYPLAGDGAFYYPQGEAGGGDGASALAAPMQSPQAIAVDRAGNVLIGEDANPGSGERSVVRMVAAARCSSGCAYGLPATVKGDIYTVAGVNSTVSGFSGDGGPATAAYLDGVGGLGFDSAGDLLIADTYNNRVRLVTPAASFATEPEGPSEPPTERQPESTAGEHLTRVNVRIEGRTKTLFEGPIWTEGHDVHSAEPDGGNAAEDVAEHPCDGVNQLDPQNLESGPTPTAASVDAMELIGETEAMGGQWYPGFNDYFIKQWGSEAENAERESKSWGILVNNVYTDVGGCQYQLHDGDEVLWVYNAFQSRPILGLFAAGEHYSSGVRPLTATAELNRPFEVEVDAYDDDGEGQPPATPERTSANTEPYEGAEVAPVQTGAKGFESVQRESAATATTDSEGKTSITFATPGWHRIMAGTPLRALTKEEEEHGVIPEEEAIRSNRLDVCVPPAGQTGCGELPAEDQARTPPRYLRKGEEPSHEQPAGSPTDGSPGSPTGSPSSSPMGSPSASTVSSAPTTKPSGGGPVAPPKMLAAVNIDGGQLKLDFTAAGKATIQIARQAGRGGHRHWQTIRQLAAHTNRAGTVQIKLPTLASGLYRVTISLPGTKSIVKMLTVPYGKR
jgi:ferredoxin